MRRHLVDRLPKPDLSPAYVLQTPRRLIGDEPSAPVWRAANSWSETWGDTRVDPEILFMLSGQRQQKKLKVREAARQAAIVAARAAGQLDGKVEILGSEAASFRRMLRGKARRALFTEVGDRIYTFPWTLWLFRERRRFRLAWERAPAAAHPGHAYDALRRLLVRAARSEELRLAIDTAWRMDAPQALVAVAAEALAQKGAAIAQDE